MNKSKLVIDILDIPIRKISDIEFIQNCAEFLGCYARFTDTDINYFDLHGTIISPINETVNFFNKKTRTKCVYKDINNIIVIIILAMSIHNSELVTHESYRLKCVSCSRRNYSMKKCCNKIVF
jgi:hypothetical protein